MPQIRKVERNKKIVSLRDKNKLSFPQIGKLVGLKHHSQVIKIYYRDKDLYKGDR